MKQVLTDLELICPKKHELNVANVDQVMKFQNQNIDWIVHLSCETDHEYCDVNPSQCYFVNTIGTRNMVELAKAKDIPIIYISTASVFNGSKNEPYLPTDEPNPINHYNKSKWYGEILTREYHKHIILRTGWMFGGGTGVDKKFVSKIINKIRDGQETIRVADDCIGSPTYSKDLAGAIGYVIKNLEEDSGTFNAVNECGEGVSRYEFGESIVDILRRKDVMIQPCGIDDLKEEFPCKRTNYEVLAPGIGMRHWRKALKEYINEYYN